MYYEFYNLGHVSIVSTHVCTNFDNIQLNNFVAEI